jgi:hypothetical protein
MNQSPETFVTAVQARHDHCFTNINVLIALGWRLARRREIISRLPEKIHSTATGGPARGLVNLLLIDNNSSRFNLPARKCRHATIYQGPGSQGAT